MEPLLRAVTDLADQAVILPVVAVGTLALAILGWRRGAFGWSVGAVITLSAVLGLKLLAGACRLGTESASGHTASAALIAGALAWLFLGREAAALAIAFMAAAVIGATRLALGLHSAPDVLVGATIGLAGAVLVTRLAGPPPPTLRRRVLALALMVALFSTYGRHLKAESLIRAVAGKQNCFIPP